MTTVGPDLRTPVIKTEEDTENKYTESPWTRSQRLRDSDKEGAVAFPKHRTSNNVLIITFYLDTPEDTKNCRELTSTN